MSEDTVLGPVLHVGRGVVRAGTCSWTDKTLVKDSDWYPRKTMTAAERLAYYAAHFPLVEVDSTYYAPPSERTAGLWAANSPDGFEFDVKAYSLLTGHPTRAASLWKDMREAVLPEHRGKDRIYPTHLEPGALDEAWRRFLSALAPLREAGRLSTLLFQYPPWFHPRRDTRQELERLPERLDGLPAMVELRSPRWTATERDRERTLSLLESLELSYVCVDAPAASELPRLLAVTHEPAVLRCHGRSDEAWKQVSASAAERFRYRYDDAELEELAGCARELAEQASETHVLMNNCYRDYAVRNAAELIELIGRGR
ncbi:MAG TPA: DUF72 domain-containing protein [Solirubrobacteraceae bacterium]|jgi:uncharacterized protein YecE (DUF72 family)|nr:DUF72 domain-containing protein [Solirubrobacteraceae bacterium]